MLAILIKSYQEDFWVFKVIKLLFVIVFAILGAAFAIINNQPASLDLYFTVSTFPLSLILLLAIGVGIVLGALASSLYFMRIKKENNNLRRQSKLVEQEVKNLRTLPLNGR
tara:strand:- start:35 stop:367 length:333 start_codon:yes stop_codon:yes gene_type:complete